MSVIAILCHLVKENGPFPEEGPRLQKGDRFRFLSYLELLSSFPVLLFSADIIFFTLLYRRNQNSIGLNEVNVGGLGLLFEDAGKWLEYLVPQLRHNQQDHVLSRVVIC